MAVCYKEDTSRKASELSLQGGGSDEALAHATDTDNIATPAPAVLDD